MNQPSLDYFCNKIMLLDKTIRFAGTVNKSGVLVASAYREGLKPLMTREETSRYAIQAVTRAMLREDFTAKLGKTEYSITKYQRLIRALVPFEYENNRLFMLLSFDLGSNPIVIIEDKVIPHIRNHPGNN
jgi:hypothetical protein